MSKFLKISVFGVLAIGLFILVILGNFQRCVEIYATHALGREVGAQSMQLSFHPLRITAKELHVANAAWGSQPDLFSIGELDATLEAGKLLTGDFVFRDLKIDNARLLLERDDQGNGNWKAPGASSPVSPQEEAANSRKGFPTLLNATIHNSGIVMITSSKARLNIDFHDARILADDTESPVLVEVDGAYHDIPVQMHVQTASYAALRKVSEPFSSTMHAKSDLVTADAALEMMDPLNFDQFTGTVKLGAKNLGHAIAFFGSALEWNVPFSMASSDIARQGDTWSFKKAGGVLGHNPYAESDITLKEGNREKPDALQAEVHFEKMDVAELLHASGKASHGAKKGDFFKIEPKPSLLLDAIVTMRRLTYQAFLATNVRIHPLISSEKLGIQDISMQLFNGELRGYAMAEKKGDATNLRLNGALSRISAEQTLQAMHQKKYILRGDLSAQMEATAKGNTPEVLRSLRGKVSVSMSKGQISRQLIRIASADIRAALHSDPAVIPISCMAAQANFMHGASDNAAFRLTTPEGSLVGEGSLNLAEQTMDLFFQTQAKTTSSYALDFPIRLSGALQDPHITIASNGSTKRRQKQASDRLCYK